MFTEVSVVHVSVLDLVLASVYVCINFCPF